MANHGKGAMAQAMASAVEVAANSAAQPVETAAKVEAPATLAAAAAEGDGFEDPNADDHTEDAVSPLRQLITGYRIEDGMAATINERKPKRKGDPSVRSRRLARVYWKVGGDSNPYWLGMPSTINAITETFPDGSIRKRITISGPGAMVGDDTWYPCLALDGQRTKTDPEMKAMCEAVRREWLAARAAAVKNGTAALAAKTAKPDQVGAEELAALGLSDFDAVIGEESAAKS